MELRAVNKFISTKKILIICIVLFAALVVFLLASKRNQDVRKKAAVPNGPAQYLLTPSTSSIPAGSPFTVTLSVNTQNIPVDGFQVVTKFTGTIPSDLAFNPIVPKGLKAIRNTIRDNRQEKVHELVLITSDPAGAPFLSSSIVSLGRYAMTGASSGSLTISFNTNLSKVLQNGVAQDILRYPDNQTYTFVPKSTVTPTPSFTPTPTKTPTSTTTPTPTPPPPPPQPKSSFRVETLLQLSNGKRIPFLDVNARTVVRYMQPNGKLTKPRVCYQGNNDGQCPIANNCMKNGLMTISIASGGKPCTALAPGWYSTHWNKTVVAGGQTYTLIHPLTSCSGSVCTQEEYISSGKPYHYAIYEKAR